MPLGTGAALGHSTDKIEREKYTQHFVGFKPISLRRRMHLATVLLTIIAQVTVNHPIIKKLNPTLHRNFLR